MIIHPQFDPVALQLGPLAIRWYALSYIVGFVLFMWLGRYRIKQGGTPFTVEMLDDFLTWGVLGVILGGRLGFVLFYQPEYYLAHPADIVKVWNGGMSFHGGFLGVLAARLPVCPQKRSQMDAGARFHRPARAARSCLGAHRQFHQRRAVGADHRPRRLLGDGFPAGRRSRRAAGGRQMRQWGRVARAIRRAAAPPFPALPFALEGVLLFAIVWWFSGKPRPTGQTAMLFLAGYGLFRFIAEYARQPDDYLGLLTLGLSMGQWLSLPMLVLGVAGFVWFGKRAKQTA